MDAIAGTVQAGERSEVMERGCDNCKYLTKGVDQYPCVKCKRNNNDIRDMWKQRTNADRIRAMSDEELAEWLHNITQFDGDDGELMLSIYNLDSEKDEEIRDSYGDLLEWLKSPIE